MTVMSQPERKKERRRMCQWIKSQRPTMAQAEKKWGYTSSTIYRACTEFGVKPPVPKPHHNAGMSCIRILAYHVGGGWTQAETAEQMGVSRQRVQQVVKEYREYLRGIKKKKK